MDWKAWLALGIAIAAFLLLATGSVGFWSADYCVDINCTLTIPVRDRIPRFNNQNFSCPVTIERTEFQLQQILGSDRFGKNSSKVVTLTRTGQCLLNYN